MNWTRVLVALMLTAIVVGCDNKDPYVDENARLMDQVMVDVNRTQPIDQAVIVQHTLYPYHFFEGKDVLNDVGCRDLRLIADYYRESGVPLNVQRGGVSQELYDARVRSVAKFIADCGIADNRIQIVEGRPGGAGMASMWVVKIMSKQEPGGAQQQEKPGVYMLPFRNGESK